MKKTILITGSTDGIGKLAALNMAREGHQLYLHGRNAKKLNAVINQIKKESGNTRIAGFAADFADLSAVSNMSQQIKEQLTRLDVLIHNAGVFKAPEAMTDEGIDIRMVVNYYAPYLMTDQIIDLLRSTEGSRIINLSSAAQSSVSLELLAGKIKVSDQEAYAQSKLAILMWSFYLAKQEPDIAVVALNPGSLLNTNMVREAYGKFWSSADKGADIIHALALNTATEILDGNYFDNDRGRYSEAHPDAYQLAKISALIEQTKKVLSARGYMSK